MQTIWDIIWDHYGVKQSCSSFIDYDQLKFDKDERYIDFYDRMVYQQMNHLCIRDTDGGPSAGGKLVADDALTLSHRNLIALDWMRRINPSLPMIVKLEYSKDLKSGRPLAYLVKEIAENIDAMLHRNNPSQKSPPMPPFPAPLRNHLLLGCP